MLKNIPFVILRDFLMHEAKTGLEEPFVGGIDIDEKIRNFLQQYCTDTIIDFNLYDYQLSFDNPEWLE